MHQKKERDEKLVKEMEEMVMGVMPVVMMAEVAVAVGRDAAALPEHRCCHYVGCL